MNANRKFFVRFSLLSIVSILFIAVWAMTEYWSLALVWIIIYAVGSYFLYSRYIKGVLPRSLAPPGSEDIYFPRSNIPRPLDKDVREHPEYFEKKYEKQREQDST